MKVRWSVCAFLHSGCNGKVSKEAHMHARIKLEGNRVKWFETRRCNIMADIFHLHSVMIINRTEVKINIMYASILFYGEMGKRGETWLWHDILFKDDGGIKENGSSAKYSFEPFICITYYGRKKRWHI